MFILPRPISTFRLFPLIQGSPHLCDFYATSRLNPIGNDVRVSVPDFRPTLTETPIPSPQHHFTQQPYQHSHPPPTSYSSTSNRFPTSISQNGSTINSAAVDAPAGRLPSRSMSNSSSSPSSPFPTNQRKRPTSTTTAESFEGSSPVKSPRITNHLDALKVEVSTDSKPDVEALDASRRQGGAGIDDGMRNDTMPSSPALSDDSDIICEEEVFAATTAAARNANAHQSLPTPNIDRSSFQGDAGGQSSVSLF